MIRNAKGTVQLVMDGSFRDTIQHYLEKVPAAFADAQKKRDKDTYHITITTPEETKTLKVPDLEIGTQFFILGMGSSCDCYYLVCHYPSADVFRMKNGLAPMDFHVTLGFNHADNHEIQKGVGTLKITTASICTDVTSNRTCRDKFKMLLEDIVKIGKADNRVYYELAKLYANEKRFELALATAELIHDDLMRYYELVLKVKDHLNLITPECVNDAVERLTSTRLEHSKTLEFILDTLNKHLKKTILCYTGGLIVAVKLPFNFSMVDEFVGGSGLVSSTTIAGAAALGFKKIISLTEEKQASDSGSDSEYHRFGIEYQNYPVHDRTWTPLHGVAPMALMNTVIESIADSVSRSEKVLVHCLGGVGRTNVVLACYLVSSRDLPPAESMALLESQRKVKFTTEQINFIKLYYGTRLVRNDKAQKLPKLPKLPKVIVMVGAPCSGKTTLSNKFIATYPRGIVHINQDDLGKKECIELFLDSAKGQSTIILDRCNKTIAERKEWLDMVQGGNVVCIYFNLPLELCKQRLRERTLHPTLTGGRGGGEKILEEAHRMIEAPHAKEKFDSVLTVTNDEEYVSMLKYFGIWKPTPSDLIKFPRTRHLANLGSATRDDLIMILSINHL